VELEGNGTIGLGRRSFKIKRFSLHKLGASFLSSVKGEILSNWRIN
jgi:hypothetical protein